MSEAEQARERAMSLPSCHEKAADASRLALALSKLPDDESDPDGRYTLGANGIEFQPIFLTPEERKRLAAKRQLERI